MASHSPFMTAEQAARMLEEESSELNGSDSDIEIEVCSRSRFNHTVDMSVTLSTCPIGLNGAPCKQPYVCMKHFEIHTHNFHPIVDEAMRAHLQYNLATGQGMEDARMKREDELARERLRLEEEMSRGMMAMMHQMMSTMARMTQPGPSWGNVPRTPWPV